MYRKKEVRLILIAALILVLCYFVFSYLLPRHVFFFKRLNFDTTVKIQDKLPDAVDLPFSLLSLVGMAEVTGMIWLLLLLIAFFKRYYLTALSLLLMPLTLIIELYHKLTLYHPAPPHFLYRGVLDFNLPKYYIHTDYSYPSGHMARTSFLIVFLIFFVYLKKGKNLVVISALLGFLALMAISRVYLAEHWITDVLGGIMLGGSFGMLSGLTLIKTKK